MHAMLASLSKVEPGCVLEAPQPRLRARGYVRTNAEKDRPAGQVSKTTKGTKLSTTTKALADTPPSLPPVRNGQPPVESSGSSLFEVPFVENCIRKSGLARADGTLIFGDGVMVFTTHLASEKLPSDEIIILAVVAMVSWFATSYYKGDYSRSPVYPNDDWLALQPGYSIYVAVRESMFAWMMFVPTVLTVFASMVARDALGAAPLMVIGDSGGRVPPELEVVVALALTVPCWRGFYFALKDGLIP